MFAKQVASVLKQAGKRNFSTLVLAEHLEGQVNANLGSVLSAASKLNDPHVDVLIHGDDVDA